MSAKHTPGPWDCLIEGVEQRGGDSHTISAGEHFATVAMVPLASDASTHGEEGETVITEAEAISNARLIAAAPELLEALRALLAVQGVDEYDNDRVNRLVAEGDGFFAAIAKARTTIAKATGEQS